MDLIKSILLMIIIMIFSILVTGASINNINPTQAITRTCSRTLYPELCVNSLLDFPGSNQHDLIRITINMTLHQFRQALYHVNTTLTSANNLKISDHQQHGPYVRAAYEDCSELLEDAVYYLSNSLESAGTSSTSTHDVMTWLSSAMTCHDTCMEGLSDVGLAGGRSLKDLSKMVSNCLAMYGAAATENEECGPVAVKNRRRRRMLEYYEDVNSKFPMWVSKKERYLLDAPVANINPDIVVSKDGNGTVKTIAEAIQKAPEFGTRRTIIHVKAGRYEEDILKVGRKKINLMFVGDGKGKTVITGGKSVFDHLRTTFKTATFAASGAGFIARDMTFENWAGPTKNQSVALLINADKAVIYRCDIKGYQDTLYVHCGRQFFRECDVYGTVDFIFGNSAVVFQNCSLHARKPLPFQKITITAQNRNDLHQNTGISFHNCNILADKDLEASKGSFPTYLGRPWKAYSRTVYMMSYMGDHVHPKGWLDWNATFRPIETLYYGEYANSGPGAALGGRVNWRGYHVITTTSEASKFTVGQFICGSSWLPATGVQFMAGLSV